MVLYSQMFCVIFQFFTEVKYTTWMETKLMSCSSVCLIAIVYDELANMLGVAAEMTILITVADYTTEVFSVQFMSSILRQMLQ